MAVGKDDGLLRDAYPPLQCDNAPTPLAVIDSFLESERSCTREWSWHSDKLVLVCALDF